MNTEKSLLEQMEEMQKQYYSENTKNFFFKKAQKMECAAEISQNFSLEDLIKQTVYIIPNTNRFYLDYTVLKMYANPSNFTIINAYILKISKWLMKTYGSYEAHFNMKTFSISSAERYKEMIQNYSQQCFESGIEYSDALIAMYIYHTPSVVEQISKLVLPFIDKSIHPKIKLISKSESDERLAQFFTKST
jgi:hypothetical protein